MKYRVALEDLNHDLASCRTELESWARAKAGAADKMRDQHIAALEDIRGETAAGLRTMCESLV